MCFETMMRDYWQGVAFGYTFVHPMFKHRCDAFAAVTLHQKDVVGQRLCIYVHMLYDDYFLDDDGVSLKHICRLAEDPDCHMGIVNRYLEKEYGGWIGVCPNWRVRGKFGILDSPGDKVSFLEKRALFIEAVDWAGRYCYDACA